jgi:phage gpG-like protein
MIDADAIERVLADRVADLAQQLQARVKDNLSGAILNQRSGRLAASLVSGTDDDGTDVQGFVSSEGAPYAAIQEYGGKTAAHDIIAVKAKALAFVGGGGTVFAKSVHHPGSLIPAHGYLAHALTDMQDAITADLKQSVLDALTQT